MDVFFETSVSFEVPIFFFEDFEDFELDFEFLSSESVFTSSFFIDGLLFDLISFVFSST